MDKAKPCFDFISHLPNGLPAAVCPFRMREEQVFELQFCLCLQRYCFSFMEHTMIFRISSLLTLSNTIRPMGMLNSSLPKIVLVLHEVSPLFLSRFNVLLIAPHFASWQCFSS
jgi:hypothetical protein